MNAHGTKGTSGDTFSFTEGETGADNFSLGKTITGTLNGSARSRPALARPQPARAPAARSRTSTHPRHTARSPRTNPVTAGIVFGPKGAPVNSHGLQPLALHLGTSPASLDTSSGLMSALGGMGVHAMSFAGPDILPEANPGGTEVWLEESNEVGQTPTNWVSHPSGIGYRRSSPGIITTTGSGSSASASQGPPLPGNAPSMDTGLE